MFVSLPSVRRFKRTLFLISLPVLILVVLTSSAKASTITVSSGGDLQAAINAAQCGDTVILDASASFTAPSDGLVAHTKCTTSPITVQSSNLGSLPAGIRVSATDAPKMPKIVTPGPYAAITFAANSQGWKFIGINVTTWQNIDSQHYVSTLVNIGRYVSPAPSDITFDRCWIHSQEDGTDSLQTTVKIIVDVEGENISLLNSRIASPGAYIVNSQTFDNTSAIMMIDGPGPLTIDNCFLNSWFTGFFMGGGNLSTNNTATILPSPAPTLHSAQFSNVNNLNVGDLIAIADGLATEGYPGLYYRVAKVTGISGNNVSFDPYSGSIGSLPNCTGDCGIPLATAPITPGGARWNGTNPGQVRITHSTFWINPNVAQQIYSSTSRVPKGFFEVKAADGLYLEGNQFTGWPATFALTQHNQTGPNGGPSPWSVIRNVTIRSNKFATAIPFGSQLFGLLLEDNVGTSVVGGNVLVENNLFMSGGWVGDFFAGDGVTFRHNTILNNVGWANGRLLNVSYVPMRNFSFNDNVVYNNEYGLSYLSGGTTPGLAMTGNVLITGTIDPYRPNCFNGYPAGNFCPTTQGDVGFSNPASGNYRLSLTSLYRNRASDGSDPGINQDALEAALAGGTTPAPTPTPIPTPSPSPSPLPSASPSPTATPTPTPTPTPVPTPTPQGWTNFALAANGSTAVGSSSFDSSYPVSSSIDGDRKGQSWGNGGGWNDGTSNSYPDWVEIDFPGTRTISEIDLYTLQDDYQHGVEPSATQTFSMYGITDFSVEYWNGSGWVSLATVAGNNKIKRSLSFASVTTTKVRAVVSGAYSNYSRLVEVEAWGTGAAPTPTPTPSPTPSPSPTPTPTQNVAPNVSVIAPINGAVFVVGDDVTLSSDAVDPDGQIVRVEFFANGSLVGSVTSAPYNLVWTGIPYGVLHLSAKATDNSGASTTSGSVQVRVKRSPGGVKHAIDLANSIVSGFEWSATYPGATAETNSQAVATNLDGLATDIQQAYLQFTLEQNLYGSEADQITTQLLAAYYFARGDAALAAQTGPSPNARAHLLRVIGHLSITEDLMRYGSITPATIQLALLVNARLDLMIGGASSGLGPVADGLVSPGSLGAVFGTSATTLTPNTAFADLSASLSLPFELQGVSVSVAGQAVPLFFISPTRVSFFVPQNLPAGESEVIVLAQNGYLSKGAITVMANVTRIMTAADDETGPALGVNDAKQVRETLSVTTQLNFGADKRTRLTFFATGISGSAANTDTSNDASDHGVIFQNLAESVIVEAHTQDNRVYRLPVEFAGARGIVPGLDQINVVLVPELQGAGTVDLTLIVNGRRSNAPTIVVQ